MKNFLKHLLERTRLEGAAIELVRSIRRAKRCLRNIDRKLVETHIAEQTIKKLHIGCGDNLLESWLNSDFHPCSNRIFHLDTTRTFPFATDTFDYVFSEHMIEHISYPDGIAMLSECHRILKNNGKIRISTPNLQFLLDLCQEDKTALQQKYIEWSSDTFIANTPCYDAVFVINNFVRDWGHLFIYNEKTLRSSLQQAGFGNIRQCKLNESDDALLANLENEKRMPEGFLRLESITLEGTSL